jgi:hypothetical protein
VAPSGQLNAGVRFYIVRFMPTDELRRDDVQNRENDCPRKDFKLEDHGGLRSP